MKIGAIFTGGTIGSTVGEDGYISVTGGYRLLDMYYDRYDKNNDTEFVIENPYSILSENLEFANVTMLAECIEMMSKHDLAGIIIMHGTDTLQYTAGFLHYIMKNIKLPIMLVSSAYVLDDARANGVENFKLAVDFIEKQSGRGVFVSYVNSDNRRLIHRADRLAAHTAYSSDVYSINDEYYAEEVDGRLVVNELKNYASHKYDADRNNGATDTYTTETVTSVDNILNDNASAKYHLGKRVLFIHVYPGMSIDINPAEYDAVLIESYHSGTAPVNSSLAMIAEKARDVEVPIYLVGISREAGQYETVKEYATLGIIPLYDEAPIAAYCRLCCEG